MKIQPKAKGKVQDTEAKDRGGPAGKPSTGKPNAFAGKLRRNEGQRPDGDSSPDAPSLAFASAAAASMLRPGKEPDAPQVHAASPAASPLPPVLKELVAEIVVRVDPAGPAEIEIQFTSRTLEGLSVHIHKKEEGGVNIQFFAASEGTSRLLAQHLPQLSKALSARDIPAAISLQTGRPSKPAAMSGETGGRSRKRR